MMEQILFIQTGFGVDVHGQNITKAAERAVRNAIFTNSMPVFKGFFQTATYKIWLLISNWRYRVMRTNLMKMPFARLSLMAL